MPLTEIEIAMTKAVAQYYYSQGEPVSHQQLLRTFDDPRPIIRLMNLRIIITDGTGDPVYLPTILAFNFCGDNLLLKAAKDAVTVVIREVKSLFKANYERSRQYQVAQFSADLEAAGRVPPSIQLRLGLFLAKDIPGAIYAQLNEPKKTEVVSFQINDHVLTLDPERAWDDYLGVYAPQEALTAQSLVVTKSSGTAHQRALDWPPPDWKIVKPLDEGGQGWTYLVRRKDGPDKTLYVLKRLKNKQRLPRFRTEIAALSKLKHPGILKIIDIGESSEVPFFIAEYCEGGDLGRSDLSRKDLLSKLRMFRDHLVLACWTSA